MSEKIPLERIRNFSIIAHIDHGKSTLSDRLIQICGGLSQREMSEQVLDSMDIERERGITIKAQSVSLNYKANDGLEYLLNFIDTPGHVDFSYEVSRSLSACEGALLIVDASQGVEAQSVANCYTALDLDLEVIPVLNKIDLPAADPDRVASEIEDVIGIDAQDALHVSAKTGAGVEALLEQIVALIPPPKPVVEKSLRALIIDSWFDNYLGVVSLVRVMSGSLLPRQKLLAMATGRNHLVDKVGIFTPKAKDTDSLDAGEVGYVIAGMKDIDAARVGDTFTSADHPAAEPLPGFQEMQGFRCGFLGMLHMEIIQERLEREYNLDLITTAPTVVYEVETNKGEVLNIHNPADLPESNYIAEIREPIIQANILMPQTVVGDVIKLCIEKRGVQKKMTYLGNQVQLVYEIPMNEVVLDFFDRLKSVSRGYASFDYEFLRFEAAPLVKLDILINGDKVDALAVIIHKSVSQRRGRELTEKMREIIPRQMFEVAIQAAIGSHILARSNVKALRKNVTAKCYGGDITRKRKLLEKQKAGKKRMKQIGKVEIPQEAFLAVLKAEK